MIHELNILALIKGKERFIYVYDEASRERLEQTLREDAVNPEVSLTPSEASRLIDRLRQQKQRQATE